MAELLPKSIALKSVKNQKYVVCNQSTPTLPHLLQCSGKDSHSKFAWFEVEEDVNQPNLVHVKSTYNNKYWRTASQDSLWIVADADEKQPIETLWSCTLFKREGLQSPVRHVEGRCEFIHVHTGNLIVQKSGPEFEDALTAESAKPNQYTAFIVENIQG